MNNDISKTLKLDCFSDNLNKLFCDLLGILLDLQIPSLNLILKSFSDIDYISTLLSFASTILQTPFFEIDSQQEDVYEKYKENLNQSIESCIFQNKKVTFVIKVGVFLEDSHKKEKVFKNIIDIFKDVNFISTSSDLLGIFGKNLLEDIVFHLKRVDFYSTMNESQIHQVISTKLVKYLKFIFIFDGFTGLDAKENCLFECLTQDFKKIVSKSKVKVWKQNQTTQSFFNITVPSGFFEIKVDNPLNEYIDFGLKFESEILQVKINYFYVNYELLYFIKLTMIVYILIKLI